MSKLNFASISEAYVIGSEQIKNTQSEINKLKQIIDEASKIKNNNSPTTDSSSTPPSTQSTQSTQSIQSIPVTSITSAVGNVRLMENPDDEFEYHFYKLSKNPKFEEIIKKYIIINHPNWLLQSEVNGVNAGTAGTAGVPLNIYYSNVNTNIRNYVIFFIVSVVIYLCLVYTLKN